MARAHPRRIVGRDDGTVVRTGARRLAPGAAEAFHGGTIRAARRAQEETAVPDHDEVMLAIATVVDPEAGMNVFDLGLTYGVDVDGDAVVVTMTMTTPA